MRPPKFNSFIWAGFECTSALAEKNRRFNLLSASKHDELVHEDYEMIQQFGMKTVREGFSWSFIDKGNDHFDFSRYIPMLESAAELGIQQIWDLNHFDFPEYIDPFSEKFVTCYAEYSKRVIQLLRKYYSNTIYIVPMNEPSFFAWMCDQGLWAPYQKGKGTEFKKQLIRAAIAAMDAIWQEDENVRFIHTDPFMFRQPLRLKSVEEKEFCDNFNKNVRFHSWDMICGKSSPELGGSPKYLDILGINYYFYNQQMVGIKVGESNPYTFRSLPLTHKRRRSLSDIIEELVQRYQVPVVIAETGNYRNRRVSWWKYILEQTRDVHQKKLPLFGLCAYPTLDILRGAGFIIPESGLWDFDQKKKDFKRIPHLPSLEIIRNYLHSENDTVPSLPKLAY